MSVITISSFLRNCPEALKSFKDTCQFCDTRLSFEKWLPYYVYPVCSACYNAAHRHRYKRLVFKLMLIFRKRS